MAIFKGKDGKKSIHMNPQQGKAMHGKDGAEEERLEEKISPGIHDKVEHEHERLANYDGHEHNGHLLAHHVEMHHGGHPNGEPPMHEGHTHHTITHPHSMHGGGGGGMMGEHREEPEINNHESYAEAEDHQRGAMHAECPECEGGEHGEVTGGDFDSGNGGEGDIAV